MGTPANAAVQQDAQQLTQKKPSIWRQILGIALMSGSAGLGGRTTEEAAALGGEAVDRFEERKMRREALAVQQEREKAQEARAQQSFTTQQELNKLQLEQVKNEIKAWPEEEKRRAASNALLQTQSLLAQRQLLLLPENKQEALLDKGRALAADFMEKGIPTVYSTPEDGDDLPSAQALMLRAMNKDKADGKVDFGYQLLPHPTKKDSYLVFQTPPNKFLTEPATIKFRGKTVNIPAGTPLDTYARLSLDAALKDAELEFKKHRADLRDANAPKPLDLKSALSQARQEIAPLIEADSFVPDSRKQYKSQADVTKAVNKRAQELLDLDSQLRRSGIEQPRTVLAVQAQLKALRQRGATDAQLKAAIAQAAATGQLRAEEVIALYDLLGLVPDVSKVQPTPGDTISEAAKKGAAGYELPSGVKVPR